METEDISGGVTVATQTSSLSVVRGREVKRQLEDLEDDDQDDAEVPPSFRRYVALLNRTGPRLVVLSLWISLFVLGVGVYLPLQRLLKVSVEPPYGSDSEAAKATYDKMFPPEPVTLAAMITANGEPGEMLINADATLDYQLFPLPHVSYNPVDDLTALAEVISLDLKDLMKKYLDRCDFDFYSFLDMCAGRTVCPETELQSFTHQLFFPERYGGSEGMILVHMKSCDGEAVYKECVFEKQPFCDPVAALSEDWAEYRERRTHDCIETGRSECNVLLQVVSTPYVFEDIILGVEYGMALSTVATMLAFVVLFAMLRNVRQLALVTANILCAITATIALMYPIAAFVMPVVVTAPPMLVAVALAMSIDYSLFLLSRFNQERALGRPHHRALGVALFTAGHTIAVSGATLALCFCTMLALPTSTITSMALGNAIAVCMSVVVTLTLTPTTLLAAPRFYTSSRKYGLSLDDTPFGSPGLAAQAALPSRAAPDAPSKGDVAAAGSSGLPIGAAVGVSDAAAADLAEGAAPQRDVWALLGLRVQRHARLITVLLALVAVPFALALKEFTYVEDLTPLMQTSHPATHAFIKLADTFGQDLTTPVKLLIMAPTQEDGTTLDITGDKAWSIATCHMLQSLAHNVTTALVAQGYNYTMEPRDFVGLMTFSGGCVAEGYNLGPIDIMPFLKLAAQFTMLGDVLTNQGHNATQVYAHCHEDLFSETGNAWMRTLREQLVGAGGEGVGSGGGTLLEWEGQQIGEVFAYGMPLEQMDGAQYTLRRMPVVVLAIAAIICVILGGSFGTALVPLRAVVCITWMLVVAIGASVMVYQLGYLEFLGLEALAPAGGSLFWISPSVALAVLVGLGLDYDIFLMDSVMENWQEGKDGREAVIAALDQAGTIISAAGIIMFLAFGALLASTTPVLNQIGFMLCIGVLIDCFITTKLTIPALMACVPDAANFWPKKRPPPPTAGDIEERGSVSARGSVPCLRRSLTSSARDLLGAAGTAPPSLRNTGGRS